MDLSSASILSPTTLSLFQVNRVSRWNVVYKLCTDVLEQLAALFPTRMPPPILCTVVLEQLAAFLPTRMPPPTFPGGRVRKRPRQRDAWLGAMLWDRWHTRTLSASSNLPKRIRLSLEAFMVASLPLRGMPVLAASRASRRRC